MGDGEAEYFALMDMIERTDIGRTARQVPGCVPVTQRDARSTENPYTLILANVDVARRDLTASVMAIVRRMRVPDWLDDTRTSYDTVAVSYADLLRDALAHEPFQRGILALFAELVHTQEAGPVADVGCGPGRITAHLHRIGLDVRHRPVTRDDRGGPARPP